MVSYILLSVLGLAVGSFLGSLTHRWPRGISIVSGRSICPNCKHKIAWFDNIPILSFLLLGGRCKACHKKISLRYPAIEIAASLGFVGIGYLYGGWTLPYLLLVFSTLVAIFVIDIEHQIIPDNLVFFLLIIHYSLFIIHYSPDIYIKIATGFLSALFLLGIHLMTRGRGMGLGDVKFAIFGGTFLGWPGSLIWLFLSFLTGAGVGVILILSRRARLRQKIAFGPFLVLSIALTLVWGEGLYALLFR